MKELNLRIFVRAIRRTGFVISCAQNLEKIVILENRKYFSRKRELSRDSSFFYSLFEIEKWFREPIFENEKEFRESCVQTIPYSHS